MATRVTVNKLTVVHKESGGVSVAFPDVCKTPTPGGLVPIPYTNVARSADTGNGSQSVKADGQSMMLKSSWFAVSTGDEAGSGLGVASNKIKGKAYPKMYSFDVKVEGEPVFRLSDLMLQNGGSPTNTPPAGEVQPNLGGAQANSKDPELLEVTRIAFGRQEACCGDEVALSVRTKNAQDGDVVPLWLERPDDGGALIDSIDVKMKGNQAEPKWIVRRGKYAKKAKIRATQFLFKGQEKSSKDLEVKAPEPVAKEVKTYNRLVPQVQKDPATGAWTPGPGKPWGWEVSYEIELHPGELVVRRKLDFDLRGGAKAPSARKRRAWRREIESVWDKKWKIHRTKCKRGDKCDCPTKHGCCLFVVRVRCEFGAGTGKKVVLNKGKNDPNPATRKWWYSHNWWEEHQNTPYAVRAHEFGHLIGMYDEYPTGAIDPSGLYANVRKSIMNGGTSTYKRHMQEFHDWFTAKTKGTIGNTKLLRP